ncbi:unnamed protein product [Brassica rapa]|uniref:Uncharacterized protein n=1 Tax=Brassica campestris TaxID=3711 RepID=A0A8D9GYI9_BRACM|nr:unnamed protein product [Brassica rapa]
MIRSCQDIDVIAHLVGDKKSSHLPIVHDHQGDIRKLNQPLEMMRKPILNVEHVQDLDQGRSRSKSLEVNNDSHEDINVAEDIKEERRGRSISRSLETKHKSSRRNELDENKDTGSLFSEGRHRRERRPSPEYSDENKSSSRRKGHSRSREKRESSRDKISKRHKRLRSASLGDDNGKGDRSPSPISSE